MKLPVPITDFLQFAQSQLDYISQYNSKIVCEIPLIEIYKEMKATTKIIMVTDGGAIQYKGSIGFVLTTVDGTVPLFCYGQPAGHNPMSFRSEPCVFLAATQLIFLIAEHYNKLIVDAIDILYKIHLYTASMSMIKKLNPMDTYPTAHLKHVMDLEWDILQTLRTLMMKLTVPGDALISQKKMEHFQGADQSNEETNKQ